MSRETFALILWLSLALSVLLTFFSVSAARWEAVAVAAVLSFGFAVVGILSVGPFVLLLTLLQIGAAVAIKRSAGPRGWLAALGIPAGVWMATIGALLAPYWF